MPNGAAVANIRIATSEAWKDQTTGQQQERTEWHSIVFYRRLAEIAGEYLRKGAKVYVEGSLRTRKWQDKNGMDRYTTEIIGNEMQMLDRLSNMPAAEPSASRPAPARQPAAPPAGQPDNQPPDFDDDIPF